MTQFEAVRIEAQRAASLGQYPDAVRWLEDHLPAEHVALATANLIYFLPRAIARMETKKERRAAIDQIPNDHGNSFFKAYIKFQVIRLFRSRSS